jgi:hemerythrin
LETIKWDDWLELQIPSIDEEHRRLFDLIRELNEAVLEKREGKVLKSVLDGLVQYTSYHFKHEEELFSFYSYPDKEVHTTAHQAYAEKVNEFMEAFEAGDSVDPNLVLIFLNNWWVSHIVSEDRAYSLFMIENGVQ